MTFKLTYSTMFDPPEELHERFEAAVATLVDRLGRVHPIHVDGKDLMPSATFDKHAPSDTGMLLGRFAPILAALALAGALSWKQPVPVSAGTLRTTTPTFVATLIFVIVLVAALNFIPALALGPVGVQLASVAP